MDNEGANYATGFTVIKLGLTISHLYSIMILVEPGFEREWSTPYACRWFEPARTLPAGACRVMRRAMGCHLWHAHPQPPLARPTAPLCSAPL
jgi:hypothetical protein